MEIINIQHSKDIIDQAKDIVKEKQNNKKNKNKVNYASLGKEIYKKPNNQYDDKKGQYIDKRV